MDARALIIGAGYSPASMSSRDFTMLSNAVSAAYSEGYINGYSAAIVAPSGVYVRSF